MSRVLITGGGGFIGSHLAERMRQQDYETLVFDQLEDKRKKGSSLEWVRGSVSSRQDLKKIKGQLNGIVHLAAISRVSDGQKEPARCIEANVMGTVNILEVARSMKSRPWVILGSTNEPPKNIYGLSKRICELCAQRYSQDYGIRIAALRFSTVYGSARDNSQKLIPKWITKALSGEQITIDNKERRFDFIYIDDLIAGIIAAVKLLEDTDRPVCQVIPICSGRAVNLGELAEVIVGQADSDSSILVKQAKQEMNRMPDSQKAVRILNFRPQTDIKRGIKLAIQDVNS